jgi:transposase
LIVRRRSDAHLEGHAGGRFGHGKARNGYLWTSNISGGSVLYRWHGGRDQDALIRLLGDGTDPFVPAPRVIECDGYAACPAWSRDKPGVTLAGCHAHLRRKFFEAKESRPRLPKPHDPYPAQEALRPAG